MGLSGDECVYTRLREKGTVSTVLVCLCAQESKCECVTVGVCVCMSMFGSGGGILLEDIKARVCVRLSEY